MCSVNAMAQRWLFHWVCRMARTSPTEGYFGDTEGRRRRRWMATSRLDLPSDDAPFVEQSRRSEGQRRDANESSLEGRGQTDKQTSCSTLYSTSQTWMLLRFRSPFITHSFRRPLSRSFASFVRRTTMTPPQSLELSVGISAVVRASIATSSIFKTIPSSLTKSDSSPVTLGDFAAQAIVNTVLSKYFPQDGIVAEEEAEALRQDQGLRSKVSSLVKEALSQEEQALTGQKDFQVKWTSADWEDEEAILKAIDLGAYQGGKEGRFWTLDPIDGTKGFLRGGQYAICLALIEQGEPILAVMACPNLPYDVSSEKPKEGDRSGVKGDGSLFIAVKGGAAWQVSCTSPTTRAVCPLITEVSYFSYLVRHPNVATHLTGRFAAGAHLNAIAPSLFFELLRVRRVGPQLSVDQRSHCRTAEHLCSACTHGLASKIRLGSQRRRRHLPASPNRQGRISREDLGPRQRQAAL